MALVLWTLLRAVLWLATGPALAGWDHAAGLFGRGLGFDLATLAYTLAPWLLASALLPDRWRGARFLVGLRWFLLWLVVALLLFGAVAEFTFWQEFATRFNFIAVDYLVYTREVVGNIRQSYPVPAILVGIAGASVAIVAALHRVLWFSTAPLGARRRAALAVLAFALPALGIAVANVDQMNASGNAYADELSGNGLFSFAAAYRRNELDYDRFFRTLPQDRADAILVELGVERLPLSAALQPVEVENAVAQMGPFTRRPRNIVLISVESLSAEFLGAYGNGAGLTPNLDRLAAEGLQFTRFFATGTRTVRGLEALSLGVPPVPGQSIVRRPGNEHLATVGEMLEHQGYQINFLYGGYGYFDNMNAFFKGNDYDIVDRSDFPPESIVFENAWGVADEVLFANALRVFDQASVRGKPFFAHVMTTSNHRPFTYPAGRIDIPSPGGREGGVKYTDFAIGEFIARARRRRLAARQPDRDPPTILDLFGAAGDDHFFGQGLFEDAQLPARAFVSNYQALGYYKGDVLTVLLPKRRVEAFRIDPQTFAATAAQPDPRLTDEAIAYYQTASRAFRGGRLRSPDYPAR
ncbi:MAG: sulfatase-like hydrolase/transferase [Betaproteobacteria bacterium]|nr:sulfatase-like hydrolase/transferase [Betaproteobacteria bacterium]